MSTNPTQNGKSTEKPTWQKPTLTNLSIESTKGGTFTYDVDNTSGITTYKLVTAS